MEEGPLRDDSARRAPRDSLVGLRVAVLFIPDDGATDPLVVVGVVVVIIVVFSGDG